jgi:hypothetical protein
VILRPPGGAPASGTAGDFSDFSDLGDLGDLGDVVTVVVMRPDPHAPEAGLSRLLVDPTLAAGGRLSRLFSIDGLPFAQVISPLALPASTLLAGGAPNHDEVRVLCLERAKPDLVRAGCRVVIDSLHVRT